MTHKQILESLSASKVVQAIDEDLARLTFRALCFKSEDEQCGAILSQLLLRWNCILQAEEGISDNYKNITVLAIAVLLHKYGYAEATLTDRALRAIDLLNKSVALSDHFFHRSGEIKKFICSEPVRLKRRPSQPESVTFYRPKDLISIQLEQKFYAAYIHSDSGVNESPVIEFYNGVFDHQPTIDEVVNLPAIGNQYQDDTERVSYFRISGMKFLPDPANQIQLIASAIDKVPNQGDLQESIGLYCMEDLFSIIDVIQRFKPRMNQLP